MEASFPYQDAWTRARDRYIEDLTEKEKSLYYQATPETLFYDASAARKRYTAGSTTFAIIEKLQPLREAIDQYGQALDVYSNAYPLVLSPLWGSIRVVLFIAGEFGKYFEKLVEIFTRIGDVLPRFRVYERLFSNHERLVQALSLAYVDIVVFCSECKTVFRHGQRSSMTSFKIAFKLIWKPFERQFGRYVEGFRQHRKSVEKEAGLSHMIEAADSRDLVLANQMQLEQQRKADTSRRTLAAIPCVDTKAKHMKLQGLRYHGTGMWFFEDHVYLDWQRADTSSFLCCHGIPGCGKSVLASMVVDAVLNCKDARVIYYYCDYTDQRTLQINRILGTLLKQFFAAGQIPSELALPVTQVFGDDSRSFTSREIEALICSAIGLNSAVTIVLDGLDECEQEAKEQIVAFLERLTILERPIMKLLVFCRKEDNILRSLTKFSRIDVTLAASANDITSFVSGSVRSRIKAGKLRIRNPELEQEIVSELVTKAKGMFLWVFYQLNELCEAVSDAKIRETLSNLPDGISETYERILSKITNRQVRYIVSKMFTWIIYAQRPLKVAELQEAVAFDIADKIWDGSRIPHEDTMIESCRGLIVRDEDDNTVRLAHYTVQQYILQRESTDKGDGPGDLLIESAPEFLGQMCITYLSFSDFERQLARRKPDDATQAPGILRSGGPVWIPSILGIGNFFSELAYRLSGVNLAASAPTVDWTRHLEPTIVAKDRPSAEYADNYALLQYVIDFWVFHTKYLDTNSDICHRLRDLVCNETLPFEFRPWGRNRHFGPYGCVSCPDTPTTNNSSFSFMSLFHYAAEAGHWPLMEPHAREYCAHERYTDETLLLACRYGQDSIVEKLWQVHKFDKKSSRALNVAAASGHASVLRSLLTVGRSEVGADKLASLDEALILAASNGHEEAFGLIWGRLGAIQSMSVETQRAALFSAATNGHELVVNTIFKRDVGWIKNNNELVELSPLLYAAENGHASVVRTLFNAHVLQPRNTFRTFRSLINDRDASGRTALHKAAANGHVGTVQTLLEYGASYSVSSSARPWLRGHPLRGTPIDLAAEAGHESVVLELLPVFDTLLLIIHDITWYKHEDMVRRLLESHWKHFKRSSIEHALEVTPTMHTEYYDRMTELLRSTLAKIDTAGREAGAVSGEMHNNDGTERINSLATS